MAAVLAKNNADTTEKTNESVLPPVEEPKVRYRKLIKSTLERVISAVERTNPYFTVHSSRANYRSAGRNISGYDKDVRGLKWFAETVGMNEDTFERLGDRIEGFAEWLDEDADDCVDAYMRMGDLVDELKSALLLLTPDVPS